MNHSLQKVKSKHRLGVLIPRFFLTKNPEIERILIENGLTVHVIESSFKVPVSVEDKIDNKRWRSSFDKLNVFGLTKFDKIVFLDSDMLLIQNIDHLFDKRHLSFATGVGNLAKYDTWILPNSGLMVVTPEKDLDQKIFATWGEVSKNIQNFGDQNLINHYFREVFTVDSRWLLSTKYNTLVFALNDLVNKEGYNFNQKKPNTVTISVLHFALRNRPWLMTRKQHLVFYAKNLIKGRRSLNKAHMLYLNQLKKVKDKNPSVASLVNSQS